MQLPPTVLAQAPRAKSMATSETSAKKPGPVPVEEVEDSSDTDDDSDSTSNSADDASAEKPKDSVPTKESSPFPRPLKPPKSLEVTMFERLETMYGPSVKRMLKLQYRCVFFSSRTLDSELAQ